MKELILLLEFLLSPGFLSGPLQKLPWVMYTVQYVCVVPSPSEVQQAIVRP